MLFSAIKAGASGYVLKQIDSEGLINRLKPCPGEKHRSTRLSRSAFSRKYVKRWKEEEAASFVNLSQQEKMVLKLVSEGKTNRGNCTSTISG